MAGDATQDVPWLSPAAANRLLTCPYSVTYLPTGGRPVLKQTAGRDVGTLAHVALQRWIETGSWRSAVGDGELARLFSSVAEERGVDVAKVADGRMTAARLRRRASELREVLCELGGEPSAECEVTLYDDDRRLWGTVDVLLPSRRGPVVLDLKSGGDAAATAVPDSIAVQLWMYAALIERCRGARPRWLGVYSLRRGLKQVALPSDRLTTLLHSLNEVRAGWLSGDRTAIPTREHCRYCRRRPDCQPHWNAVSQWSDPDGVEGRLVEATTAQNGRTAALPATPTGSAWVSDVSTRGMGGWIGRWVRLVRVNPRRDQDGEPDLSRWRANEQSAVYAVEDR
ncbi:PD-(D/E)XK nuclease superfamily protein [Geodermatophilus siccatus]|uniref:PD-(D/E)XK nuclease superfamily protein n=1 Tax=Geodermatophilus siccatus TaxID=1137991 RepID=A0A1G9T2V6_9ACTN|nr:PD-(D/E)XK nuclease superfamily protein [Geodermatophilus siccatus]